jgi:DNA-binding NarL/FixJ family response regulator
MLQSLENKLCNFETELKSMSIKVSVYEDNLALRETLAEIIRSTEDFELAGEFGHCLDVVANCRAFDPDVIIMDIDMPGKSGIDGVRELKSVFPNIEVIINTVFDDDNRIFEAIQAGATGYLLKKNSLATLMNSILEVKSGGAPMSPSIARKVLNLQQDKSSNPVIRNLSEKELVILNHLAKGLSYKMVSAECNISIDTVRTYIKRIYEKLQVHSVTEAVHKVFIKK